MKVFYEGFQYKFNMSINQRIQHLSNISTASGLIMKTSQNKYGPIKLALEPYRIKKNLYLELEQISKVWQKLIYKASKDTNLIERTFQQVAKVDEMVRNLFKIYLKTLQFKKTDSLMFTRMDFFKNTQNEFKIIEYNLTSVSMASHSENYAKAMKLAQMKYDRTSIEQTPLNNPCSDISQSIQQMYKLKDLKGIFLMVVGSKQKNVIDQTCIQMKLLQRGITVKRQNMCCLYTKLRKQDSKIFLQNQQISMVYYRTGYQPSDYCHNGQFQQCWKARQIIQLSDAIKIPDIKMELMNQKRMQVQLSKKNVHLTYITQEQSNILNKSLVFTTDFQENTQKIDFLKFIEQKGLQKFILKPNLQGGGNNIYGKNAYELLKTISQDQRKKYIMMEKIITEPVENTVFMGNQHQTFKCICEISKYGIVVQIDGNLIKNSSDGYLVRIKPEYADQGGVMAGVGAIAAMTFEK